MAAVFYAWRLLNPEEVKQQFSKLYTFLWNKWYFDELYGGIFVRSAKAFGALLWKRGDGDIIDGSLNGIAMGIVPFFTRRHGRRVVRYEKADGSVVHAGFDLTSPHDVKSPREKV